MSYDLFAHIVSNESEESSLRHVRSALSALEEATRTESGCLAFTIKESTEEPGHFFLWESWQNQQALEAHFSQPHTQQYLALGYTEVKHIVELRSLSHSAT